MYFNYHAKLKRLIREGHCISFEFVETYHGISPCLVLNFDNGSSFPVREHHFQEYQFLLMKYDVKELTCER